MGKFISVLLACIHFFFLPPLFREAEHHEGSPALSFVFTVFSVCFVLWTLPLYPRRLRKLFWVADNIFQFIVALYLLEFFIYGVWAPLEDRIINLPNEAGSFLNHYIDCDSYCQFLRGRILGVAASLFWSLLVLLASLHATRIVNLRLLSQGLKPFIVDITVRLRRFLKRFSKSWEFSNLKPRIKSKKEDYCSPDDDMFETEPQDLFDSPNSRDYFPTSEQYRPRHRSHYR